MQIDPQRILINEMNNEYQLLCCAGKHNETGNRAETTERREQKAKVGVGKYN